MMIDPAQIQLTPVQQGQLAELSATIGKPWPLIFDEALSTYRRDETGKRNGIPPNESFLAAAMRLGLVGSLEGGPTDLSTNPTYMDGFGESNG